MNIRQQERILEAAVAHQQCMANISSFKVAGLSFIYSLISKLDKTTPREVILNLKRLEEDVKETKIFILVEKNKDWNFISY